MPGAPGFRKPFEAMKGYEHREVIVELRDGGLSYPDIADKIMTNSHEFISDAQTRMIYNRYKREEELKNEIK